MVDSRAFDGLPRVAPPQPDDIVAAMRAQVASAGMLVDQVRDNEVVASASSDDGLIDATVGEQGLQNLLVAERAMRLPSMDLAASIVEVVRAAEAAYTDAVLAAVGPALRNRPTYENLDNIEQLGRAANAAPYELQDVFERYRRGVTGS